jgi:hypothetical protein
LIGLAARADASGADPETLFNRQWADTVLEEAVSALTQMNSFGGVGVTVANTF